MIDENLARKVYTPAQEARALARRKQLYLKRHPETAASQNAAKKTTDNLSAVPFAKATADATGKDERTIRRDTARGEALGEDDLTSIAGTSLDKGVELDALAKMKPEERAPIIADAQAGKKVSARKVDGLTEEAEKAIRKAGFYSNKQFVAKIASYADADQVEAVAEIVARKAQAKAKVKPAPVEPSNTIKVKDVVESVGQAVADTVASFGVEQKIVDEVAFAAFVAAAETLVGKPAPVEPPAPVEVDPPTPEDEYLDPYEKDPNLRKALAYLRAYVASSSAFEGYDSKESWAKDQGLTEEEADRFCTGHADSLHLSDLHYFLTTNMSKLTNKNSWKEAQRQVQRRLAETAAVAA
jgi:hypothetical protein